MKNKKGFTLIEILTVIGLIGIILIIAIPAINGIRKSIKERQLATIKEAIVSAAEVYAQNNQSLFPKEGGIIQIPVRTLVYYGYINEDSTDCDDVIGCVMNPVNNTSMNNEIITIKKIKSVTQATFGEVNEHVITFHANGATSVGGSSNFISIGCDTFTNSTCTIRVPSIERDEFTKVGFGESANSTTADYLVGQDILFNDNMSNNGVKSDYYAITSKGVAVTFYPNTGTFTNEESSIVRTCTIRNTATNCSVASQEPSVTKLGYNKKSGWYTTSSGSTTIDISKVTSNASAYAHWTANKYTVTYDCNGGTQNISTSTATYNEDFQIPANVCTRNGYTLSRWTASYGSDWVSSGVTTPWKWTYTQDITLTAQWTPNTFTVTWKNWNGTVLETDAAVAVGTTPTYNGSTPTKASTSNQSFTFTGWTPAVTSVTGNATYTATFSTTTYTCSTGVSPSISGNTCTCSDTHEVEKIEYYYATFVSWSGYCYCSETSMGQGAQWSGGCMAATCAATCPSETPYVMSGSTACTANYSCSKPNSWGPDNSNPPACGRYYYVNESYTYDCTATTN